MTTSTDQILSRILDELTELKVKNSHLEAKVGSRRVVAELRALSRKSELIVFLAPLSVSRGRPGRCAAECSDLALAVVADSSSKLVRLYCPGCSQLVAFPACRLRFRHFASAAAFRAPCPSTRRAPSDQRTKPHRYARPWRQETSAQWRGFALAARFEQLHGRLLLFQSHLDHLPRPSRHQAVTSQLGVRRSSQAWPCGGKPSSELDSRPQCHWCLRR